MLSSQKSVTEREMGFFFSCEAYSENENKNVACVAQDCCPDQEMFFKSGPDYLKYPEYVSLRRCTVPVGLSLACVRVVLPRPRRVIVVFPTTQAKSR